MSTKIGNVSQPSIFTGPKIAYTVMDSENFFKKFGWDKTQVIATDESYYADHQISSKKSITSFEVGDCITVFALEKEKNAIKAIIGWHLGNPLSAKQVANKFKGFEYTNPYDIYIIGGNKSTTEGDNCLLANIHKAIKTIFNEESQVKLELIDVAARGEATFVSANIQLDGTLTLCRHNH